METQATVTRTPLRPRFEIDETSWIYGLGAKRPRKATTALLIGISGSLGYDHMLELCAYIEKYWNPAKEHLVLDFSDLDCAAEEGVLYLMSYLYNAASGSCGEIYLVRAPFEAEAFFQSVWGNRRVHLAEDIETAISELK